jgi:glutathione S-transferase
MKLYYSPGACSLSPHIVLLEAGVPFTKERVDLRSKKTEHGSDYLAVNPKGSVPALQLDDGSVLTEGAVITQYIADHAPGSTLAPRAGTMERYRLMEMLNYIASEVHKGFSPLFNPKASSEWKEAALAALATRLDWLSGNLGSKPYLLGDTFTLPDAYLFTVLNWSARVGIDLKKWPALSAYHARIAQRPKVQQAMKAEGLLG